MIQRVNILDRMPVRYVPDKFWYPVFLNSRYLKKLGFSFRFFSRLEKAITDCDVLFVSSRFFHLENKIGREKRELLERITYMKDWVGRLFWFDVRDSTGNTQFEVLPHVTKYFKKQYLKDKVLYRKELYGNRLFTDYYHRKYGVTDSYSEACRLLPEREAHKLEISWNLGLSDFRSKTVFGKARDRFLDYGAKYLGLPYSLPWTAPGKPRKYDLMALVNIAYDRATVAFQRERAISLLEDSGIPNGVYGKQRVPKKEYDQLIQNTKVVLSLFGWGEICYREMEAFISGAALLMPDMSHIDTWPDFYVPNKTYHPVNWDLTDMLGAYRELLDNDDYRLFIARNGHETYRALWTKEGRMTFSRRLAGLIEAEPGKGG